MVSGHRRHLLRDSPGRGSCSTRARRTRPCACRVHPWISATTTGTSGTSSRPPRRCQPSTTSDALIVSMRTGPWRHLSVHNGTTAVGRSFWPLAPNPRSGANSARSDTAPRPSPRHSASRLWSASRRGRACPVPPAGARQICCGPTPLGVGLCPAKTRPSPTAAAAICPAPPPDRPARSGASPSPAATSAAPPPRNAGARPRNDPTAAATAPSSRRTTVPNSPRPVPPAACVPCVDGSACARSASFR